MFEFPPLSDPNVRRVMIGCVLLSLSSSLVGCFALLKKRALLGDALAHAILPGVCVAFMLWQRKELYVLLAGAAASGVLAMWLMDKTFKYSKLKEDTVIAFILSFFFGIGIFLLTLIQKGSYAAQSGLHQFLFGHAASLVQHDVWLFSLLSLVSVALLLLFLKELTLFAFDPNFGHSVGLPTASMNLLLNALLLMSVVLGIQTVGVVLMAAMLIIPPSTARFWTNKMIPFLGLSVLFGCLSAIVGTSISYQATHMPTGPWIVLVAGTLAMFSFLLAPKKGLLFRSYEGYVRRRSTREENLLKTFYHLGESDNTFSASRSFSDLLSRRSLPRRELTRTLSRLIKKGYLVRRSAAVAVDARRSQESPSLGEATSSLGALPDPISPLSKRSRP